ncbi:MAG: hypothetical protein A3J97_11580 [Spirochaetes bacterium RIFOXYC1_FULL_54_7]|nr:MAG: hypothetical protein A3J97_11580 [Spirochaetes bacterium RIFOXYC1_FULL_54_7]
MEQINTVELTDDKVFPDDTVLEKVLGDSFKAYKSLLSLFDKNSMQFEWRYYRDGKAWLCKVQKKTKTIVWMSAWKGYMKATIYIPEKHVGSLLDLPLSLETKNSVRAANNVGKSKPCMFEVRDETVFKDLESVMQYKAQIK